MAAGPAQIPAVGAQGSPSPRPSGKLPQHAARPGASAKAGPLKGFKANWAEMVIPIAVLSIVLAMITPLPSFFLDILISTNLTMSVIVLLVAMYITKPADFSIFPTTLLLMTLFRLALNISSARLILLNGNSGTSAAGEVIQAFGAFVVGGNYIIGVVIFLVLIAIQYVVINHGAVRISEVTARFTLDAMPGKQMSIDSDLNGGMIDEAEARARRKQLVAEAEFYGAMDGASRFTQRDAVASILITGINIIAGFLIGVLQHNMELKQALQTYTVLTIGDGLVTVIPALMISISGGLIVTRTSSDSKLGADVRNQIFANPQPILLAGGVLIAMAAFPGLPKIPFLVLGSGSGSYRLETAKECRGTETTSAPASAPARAVRIVETPAEGGTSGGRGGARADQPCGRRTKLSAAAQNRQYSPAAGHRAGIYPATCSRCRQSVIACARLCDLRQGRGGHPLRMPQGVELAISPGEGAAPVNGMPTREPAFGIAAFWVTPENAEAARRAGYTVVDATSVVGTHLGEVIRRHAFELLSRQDAKNFWIASRKRIRELSKIWFRNCFPWWQCTRFCRIYCGSGFRFGIRSPLWKHWARPPAITRNTVLLTEYVRQAIRRLLVKPQLNPQGDLRCLDDRLCDGASDRVVDRARRDFQPSESGAAADPGHSGSGPRRRWARRRILRWCWPVPRRDISCGRSPRRRFRTWRSFRMARFQPG